VVPLVKALARLKCGNFWSKTNDNAVDWLHQSIFDYFLACKIADIRATANGEAVRGLQRHLKEEVWEQACIIAVSLLEVRDAVRFLRDLLRTRARLAQLAFDDAPEGTQIASHLVTIAAQPTAPDDELHHIALALPYPEIVDALVKTFGSGNEDFRVRITRSVAALVIKYLPLTVNEAHVDRVRYYDERETLQELDVERIQKGVNDALDALKSWCSDINEEVRFYAAKALWHTDVDRAMRVLNSLRRSKIKHVRELVEGLIADWGLTSN
jgi:hypothetical protein